MKRKSNSSDNKSSKISTEVSSTNDSSRMFPEISLLIYVGLALILTTTVIVYSRHLSSQRNAQRDRILSEVESDLEYEASQDQDTEYGLNPVEESESSSSLDPDPVQDATSQNSASIIGSDDLELITTYGLPIGANPNDYTKDTLPPLNVTFSADSIAKNGEYGSIPVTSPSFVDITSNYPITDIKFSGYDQSKIRVERNPGSAGSGFEFIYIHLLVDTNSTQQGSTPLTITVYNVNGAYNIKTIPISWNIYPVPAPVIVP